MMIPIRCFSCGRVVASDYAKVQARVAEGESPKAVMDELGVDRYCCRRMIVSNVDLINDSAPYA